MAEQAVQILTEAALPQVSVCEQISALDDAHMRQLVRDLHQVSAATYWTDLLLTVTLGWGAFYAALVLHPFSWGMMMATVVAALSLYRALCFMHEVSHQNQRVLPHF